MTFSQLGLSEDLLRAVADSGYDTPTPIQAQAIPPVLTGRDVFGCAQTGTGKTAAFTLPILQRLAAGDAQRQPGAKRPKTRVLILTPTRELAAQIGESIETYGAHTGLRHSVIYGGVGQHPQVQALKRGVDIVVACPGRLLDLMNQGLCDLSGIGCFVLDEADRMLDMGFIHDVKRIIAKLPTKRQTLFFSATVPDEITELAKSLLIDPVRIDVAPVSSTADTVQQQLYMVGRTRKLALLKHLIKGGELGKTLVFTRTKHGADRVAKHLGNADVYAVAIHGNKSQNQRTRALDAFKAGKARVLVASDIAARGIDIDDVTHVVNFELPHEPETYVHRIGRTGRAGKSGIGIAFCDSEEVPRRKAIERLIGKVIPEVAEHPYAGSHLDEAPRPPQQQGGGRRQGQGQGRGGSAPSQRAAKGAGQGSGGGGPRRGGRRQGRRG